MLFKVTPDHSRKNYWQSTHSAHYSPPKAKSHAAFRSACVPHN